MITPMRRLVPDVRAYASAKESEKTASGSARDFSVSEISAGAPDHPDYVPPPHDSVQFGRAHVHLGGLQQ
jgi:hypothetical protein